jgi:SLAP domain-containing protein
MFSFLKNWLNKERGDVRSLEEIKQDIQEDSAVETDEMEENELELLASKQTEDNKKTRSEVSTELSLHPAWEQHLDAEKKYTLRFLQAELPKMLEGTVGVTGFSLIPAEGGVTVAMFFRNATAHPARFKNVSLTIHLDDRPFARQRFDLSELGEIPPYSSRPWEVFFPQESFLHDNFVFTRWKVLLNLGKRVWPNLVELDAEMEARMTAKQKELLMALVKNLPPMRPDSVEFIGFDVGKTSDGRLVTAILFRNATDSVYNPPKLKIKVVDAARDVVASGTVDTSSVRVRPGTSRPWLIVFPAKSVKKPDADLRKWYLDVKES